jgi:hypothetical protein
MVRFAVSHDALGTHFDWQLEGVTACHIDWFWSNMEKGFILWHPEQHEPMTWPVPPKHGNPLGAIHNAPQTWDDGTRRDIYIRFEKLAAVAPEIRDVIVYEHVMIAAGLGSDEAAMHRGEPMGYRVHQWQDHGSGVIGKSSGIGTRIKENEAQGKIWAAHCAQEVGNWAEFLPQLYQLYQVVTNTRLNPYADLSVAGQGEECPLSLHRVGWGCVAPHPGQFATAPWPENAPRVN